ncbi:hypothetical protein AGRA3207_005476 [Actinomadura graeca]|uniref:Uncharacterized protein n=1 Tax=Actinomadura graeca TaxID=2750812 RepID=A0ABX8QZE4_9ACTN|nr:hypothetical protein [Actinomadura graeca]QXJ24201.1 hypothetical protein AGRA3207_005476 [Actinomadura graeca]
MASERDPAAGRVRLDPEEMNRRLRGDVGEIEALGRTGARVDVGLGDATVPGQVRALAGRVGFESPVEAAAVSIRRISELPAAERGDGAPFRPYHDAAGRTVAEGELAAHTTDAGTRRLVFRREAPVAAGITVTLEAAVRVAADGSVWLDSFGWPDSDVPIYVFGGTREGYLAEAIAELRAEQPFDQVMLLVFATGLGFPEGGDEARRAELAGLVGERRGRLAGYVSQAESYAAAARAGAFGACLYRSALEVLFEGYLGSAALSLVDQEEMDDIDEELREALQEGDPLPPRAIPPGTPAHHWWWALAAEL